VGGAGGVVDHPATWLHDHGQAQRLRLGGRTGLDCDKLSPVGVEFHFQNVQARILEDAGPLAGRSFTAVEIDSYETGMQNWTESFPEEFRRRAGYDPVPYLPAMTGRIVATRPCRNGSSSTCAGCRPT